MKKPAGSSLSNGTQSIFIQSLIISSNASSVFFFSEGSIIVCAPACVKVYIRVHFHVIACLYLRLQKTGSYSTMMFRLQVILKVACPWRRCEAS